MFPSEQQSLRSFPDHELPRLVALSPTLVGCAFFLMKLLPARFMLDQAQAAGRLLPGGTICETTSGTFGLALAMLAAVRGYRLILVSDPAIDPHLGRQLQQLGAEVIIVEHPHATGGYQRARLDRLAMVMASNPGSYCPSQYDNPDNPGAYQLLSQFLLNRLGRIDCLIGPVGSGGSMSGTAKQLRLHSPALHVIAVDTTNSVLFGLPDGKRPLRGLGNSLMPPNLDHSQFDEVHWVGAEEAFAATRRLHRDHGLFMGGTSGAAHLVADWWSRHHPEQRCVVMLPDEGHRYSSTIYDDAWLQTLPRWTGAIPNSPYLVSDLSTVKPCWSRHLWNRQPSPPLSSRLYEAA